MRAGWFKVEVGIYHYGHDGKYEVFYHPNETYYSNKAGWYYTDEYPENWNGPYRTMALAMEGAEKEMGKVEVRGI